MLSLDTEEGGMKMISIENQHKMFLAKWTAKVLGDKKTVRSQIAKHCFTPFVSMHAQCIDHHRRLKTQPGQKQKRIPLLARSNKSNNIDEHR